MKRISTLTDWAGYCYECNQQIRADEQQYKHGGFTEFYIEDNHQYCLKCGNRIEHKT